MNPSDRSLRRVAVLAGCAVLGAAGTLAAAVALLRLVQPLRPPIYRAFYRLLGPWDATTLATIVAFTLAALLGLGVTVAAALAIDGRRDQLRVLAGGYAAVVGGVVVVLLALAVVELLAFPTVLVVVAVAVGTVLAGLRRFHLGTATAATAVGGVPVLVLLLLLLGFGLGWGGGYYLTAERVPNATGEPVTDFSEAPELRDDLFAGCEDGGRDVCRLALRGYEHDRRAARFLADHGARCPYRHGGAGGDPGSFLAAHDGSTYRVSCVGYGD